MTTEQLQRTPPLSVMTTDDWILWGAACDLSASSGEWSALALFAHLRESGLEVVLHQFGPWHSSDTHHIREAIHGTHTRGRKERRSGHVIPRDLRRDIERRITVRDAR